MNKTTIEWCDYTWNPVTGCLHSCRYVYCYNTIKSTSPLNRFGARYVNEQGTPVYEKDWRLRENGKSHVAKKGEIYPFGYDPTFYPHRLEEPLKVKKGGRVFVVDTGDLFGNFIPTEWINAVIDVARRCPQHTFQFLTKNPKRLLDFTFPDNAWVGTSINSDKDRKRVDIIKKVAAPVKYLSIEPLLGRVGFSLEGLQWIIIGAQTGGNAVKPKKEWVEELLLEAKKHNIPVFLKENLQLYYQLDRKEFPSEVNK